jgi:hypothetical protein
MKPLRAQPVRLTANAWVDIGTQQVKLRVSPHDGDASFENFGELTLRCSAGNEIKADLRGAGMTIGATAVAWSTDGLLALSVVGIDGGEDTTDFLLDTAVIDVATTCRQSKLVMWTR